MLQISWRPLKGIDLALRAAKQAGGAEGYSFCLFWGDGANRKQYERLAADGIDGHVTWTGQLEDLAGVERFGRRTYRFNARSGRRRFVWRSRKG